MDFLPPVLRTLGVDRVRISVVKRARPSGDPRLRWPGSSGCLDRRVRPQKGEGVVEKRTERDRGRASFGIGRRRSLIPCAPDRSIITCMAGIKKMVIMVVCFRTTPLYNSYIYIYPHLEFFRVGKATEPLRQLNRTMQLNT